MTLKEAEAITGLEARIVLPIDEMNSPMFQIGNSFRYQLGFYRNTTVYFTTPDAQGKPENLKVTAKIFHLVAFGASFYDAVAMHRRNIASNILQMTERKAA